MAGKKRTRKAAAGKGKASQSAKANSKQEAAETEEVEPQSILPHSPLYVLIQELHRLAARPRTCQKCMQALADGTAPVLNIGTALASASSASSGSSAFPITSSGLTGSGSGSTTKKNKKKKKDSGDGDDKDMDEEEEADNNEDDDDDEEEKEPSPEEIAHTGYWILMATHMLNRLLASLDNNNNNQKKQDHHHQQQDYPEKVAQLMSLIAYYTSRILLPTTTTTTTSAGDDDDDAAETTADQHKAAQKVLEKACINRARGLLGRAILSLAVSTTISLEALVGTTSTLSGGGGGNGEEMPEDEMLSPLALACWIPTTLALDSVVRLSQACPKFTTMTTSSSSATAATVSSSSTAGAAAAAAAAAVSNLTSSLNSMGGGGCTPDSIAINFWNQSQSELHNKAMSIWPVFREDLESICTELSTNMKKWEEPCLAALLGIEKPTPTGTTTPAAAAAAAPSPAGADDQQQQQQQANKRARTTRKSSRGAAAAAAAALAEGGDGGAAASTRSGGSGGSNNERGGGAATIRRKLPPLVAAFAGIVDPDDDLTSAASAAVSSITSALGGGPTKSPHAVLNGMKIDGRIASKRWSSMAFVWILQGRQRMLEALVAMLMKRQQWHTLIDDLADDYSKQTKKTTAAAEATTTTTSSGVIIPANVALLAIISRLIGIITETNANSGTRAPSGGLEAYVRAILPRINPTSTTNAAGGSKKPVKKGTKAGAAAQLPDLRSLVTVVLYHLVQAHQECLQENIQHHDKEGYGFVNDDDYDELEEEEEEEEEEVEDEDEEDEDEQLEEVEVMEGVEPEEDEEEEEDDDDKGAEEEDADAEAEEAEQKPKADNEKEEEAFSFLPAMKQVVEGLCRATCSASSMASGTGTSSSSLADQALGVERLQRIAGAFVLQSICQEAEETNKKQPVLDVHMVHFALSQFSQCLEKTELSFGTVAGEQQPKVHDNDAVKNHYHLLDSVPVPSMTPVAAVPRRGSRNKASSNDSELCAFGGVFGAALSRTTTKEVREDDVLSIFVRAVTGCPEAESKSKRTKTKRKQTKRSSKAKEEEHPSSAKLYTNLLSILQRCYQQTSEVLKEPEPKKRPGPAATEGSARKRRKTNEGKAEDVEEKDSDASDESLRRPLNAHRAALATLLNNVLRKCISTSHTRDTWALSLRKSLKDGFEKEHIFQIVGLSKVLDEFIIVPRTASFLDEKAKSKTKESEADSTEDASDAPNFATFEKQLWLSHANLCITIGRGGEVAESTVEETKLLSERPLKEAKTRLAVFRNIASSFGKGGDNQWPLWLPPGVRAMVAYEITGHKKTPGVPDIDTTPERFVVNGYIESMSKALQDLHTYKGNGSLSADDRAVVDNDVALSLHDARLFLVAVGRLNATDQSKCLSKLVVAVKKHIQLIAENDTDLKIIFDDYEVSSLVARIITVCSYLVIMVAYPELQLRLRDLVRHSQSPELPGFRSENDWYRSERCFMGLFSDWESSRVSLMEAAGATNITSAVATDMVAMLEQCFDLGFKAAKADRGQLLFAAWNAMGNRPLWDMQLRGDRTKTVSVDNLLSAMQESDDIDLPKILSHIREDICNICVDMHVHNGQSASLPLPLKLIQAKDRMATTQAQIKKGLKGAVTTGERLVGLLLANEETPPALFPALEAAAVLITFGIASHTKPGTDVFSSKSSSTRRKRPRGYSSESERDPSDFVDYEEDSDTDEDASSKVRERLRTACGDFGAAPTHPDWLDEKCRLQYGFSSSDVVDSARTAVRALQRLLATCFAKYKMSLQDAINSLCKQQEATFDKDRAVLARKVLVLLTRYESHVNNRDIDYGKRRELVSALADFDVDAVDAFTIGRASENYEEAKTAWCPNSAQRIPGRFHDTNSDHQTVDSSVSLPELRVNSQWEVLLGTTLSSCCRWVQTEDERESSNDGDADINKAILDAENWLGVCETAISCLMPAAALLRFGLSRSGRQKHRLATEGGGEDENLTTEGGGGGGELFRQHHIKEKLPVNITASKPLRDLTSETVALLARFSGQCTGHMPISLSCHAVATNLLIDGRAFEHLRGFESLRFALTTLMELKEANWTINPSGADLTEPSNFLTERLISIIEFWGREWDGEESSDTNESCNERFERLMALLCSSKCYKIETIADLNGIEASTMLSALDGKGLDDDTASLHESAWTWSGFHENAVTTLTSLMCSSSAPSTLRTKGCIATMLGGLASTEYKKLCENGPTKLFITTTLVKAFNSVGEGNLSTLLTAITKPESDALFQRGCCSLLAYLVCARTREIEQFSKVGKVVTLLLSTMSSWLGLKSKLRDNILDLLLLYGCCDNALSEIGSALLSESNSMEIEGDNGAGDAKTAEKLEAIAKFFRFLHGVKAALEPPSPATISNAPSEAGRSRPSDMPAKNDKNAAKPPPQSCSYALKSGFHGQHWYNCYSCGLTWDKGCCSLCALVCHAGHDVSYSRYSSFFCDCGAEDGGTDDPSRVSCKCLSTLPKSRVNQLFENEGWPVPKAGKPGGQQGTENSDPSNEPGTEKYYIDMVKKSFPKAASSSLDALIAEASKSRWLEKLFTILRSRFDSWSTGDTTAIEEALVEEYSGGGGVIQCRRYEFLRQSLQRRNGKKLNVTPLQSKVLVPVRASKSNTFQAKFSGSTNERLKRSKNEISRGAIVADCHGRLVIAEPCSLVFCSAVPAVNVRHLQDSADKPLSRSSLCILGSSTLKFNVVGMRFCPENDRHLVVFGTSEACVALLNASHDATTRQISLCLDLDPSECETDYIVKCEWIPGSQTCVAIGCGRFVSIFDISRAQESDNRALPLISFGLGFDANLKDIAVTPTTFLSQSVPMESQSILGSRSADSVASLFIMLENGRLYSVDLVYDCEGKLSARGQQFETTESIALPMTGVRAYQGASVGLAGSQSHSLGDGTSIFYLAQSHILLYKCSSSCVLALTLGISGKINGSFELLPHTLSPEMLGTGASGYSIGGPYTHWTELGQTQNSDGTTSFRVACVGRSWRTNQPKLLCVEFNEENVKVREISWDSEAMGLGLSLYSSFEGLCAFSLPFRVEGAASPDSVDGSRLAERAFLCAVTSNGCLLFYGEETGLSFSSTTTESNHDSVTRANARKTKDEANNFVDDRSVLNRHPITIFERLKNLSEDSYDDVVFGGDGLGSDSRELKRKLSRDNSVFLMSPRREGCTLTISLKPSNSGSVPIAGQARGGSSKALDAQNLALAAVRFQVGSTSSDCIPKKVFVQGRPVAIQSGMKKWYSISLTDEEVAMTVRSGVLAVTISQAHDASSSPLIDALEVYALDRREIDSWLPKILAIDNGPNKSPIANDAGCDDNAVTKGMVMASRSLESLCGLLGPSQSLPTNESDLLKRMIRQTAVNSNETVRECVDKLLLRLYPSPQARNSVKDEGALQGCSLLLSRCQVLLEATKTGGTANAELSSGFDNAWFTVRALLRSCLRTSSHIARCRPINYLRASDVIAENKISSGSIAVDSSKLISEGVGRGLPCEDLCELFVELSLAESAIADNTSMDQGENLAGFTLVRSLLESSTLSVVERSCHAISSFCRMYESTDQARGDGTNDLFASLRAARVVCYQCDSCGAVPIKGVRYTLLEDCDIDLCKDCFRLATEYAESKKYNETDKVAINGKVLDLSCALVKAMQPVPIVKADVTEVMDVDQAAGAESGGQFEDAAADEEEELRRALRMSMGNAADDDTVQVSHKVDQSLEDFVDSIFSSVVELLKNALGRHDSEPRLGLLLGLLIDLVHHSSEHGGKLARAKKLATEIAAGTARLVASNNTSSKEYPMLIMCLRALAYLLLPELAGADSAKQGKEGSKSESKPQVLCDVHGVPAARRRCARGEHKDRRFYVCGMERPLRCKFFVWCDEIEQKQSSSSSSKANKRRTTTKFDRDLASALWKLFSSPGTSSSPSLHLQLCGVLEGILGGWKSGSHSVLSEDGAGKDEFLKIALFDSKRAQSELYKGTFCSREKLHDFSADKLTEFPDDSTKPSVASIATSFYAGKAADVELIESSLELLALIANHETEGIQRWFCILCEVISSPNKSSKISSLAKRVLKQLCGGQKNLYHSVRDNYVFGFQLELLLQKTQTVLRTCLLLREKARQSGPRWKSGSIIGWANLQSGGLIGSELLVSEDFMSLVTDTTTGELLNDISNVAKSRIDNWKRFCGLSALPQSSKSNVICADDGILGEFRAPAPIISLLWIACGLQGPNLVKVLKLIDLALTNGKDHKTKSAAKVASSEDEEMAAASSESKPNVSWLKGDIKSPEDIILTGDRRCDVGDMHAFLMHFAYRGRTADVRKVACSIASKLMKKMKPGDVGTLLGELLRYPICDAGMLGKNSIDLLAVIQSQLRVGGKLPIDVRGLAELVLLHFKQQSQAIKHDRANGEWMCIESSSGVARKRFDLANCVHCNWNSTASAAKESASKTSAGRQSTSRTSGSTRSSSATTQTSSAGNTDSSNQNSSSNAKKEWLPEQVSGFSRGRLDSSKESTTNDAFSSFRQLKYRLALSEIHVNVNDPRGRFVKTITVYFTSRPVEDVQTLKTDAYSSKWQRCTTLNLTRGASRASSTLAVPVVAANLKIEFTDFYERPGGSKAADGTLLVHCPRCTRVVNNAHGVCGNCGEVAFQCRKCRHINYDQLQSFLCVECGFCSAGSFSFDLVAGVCSNAVAITNDDDMERTARMHNTATRLHEDLREAVREKLRLAVHLRKSSSSKEQGDNSTGGVNQKYPNSFMLSPGLRRAFQGHEIGGAPSAATLGADLLLNRSGKRGWAVKMIAMPNPIGNGAGSLPLGSPGSAAAATDRTRSLLRLARQLRTDGGSPERRRSGEVIIRQLNRGGSAIEALEEENDLLSLLENPGGALSTITGLAGAGGAAGLLDSSDPLSRLLASFQTTRTGATSRAATSGTTSSQSHALSTSGGGGGSTRASGTSGSSSSNRGASGATGSSSSRKQQQDAAKEALEESEKLHALMREAEREAFELSRRMDAWKRLERDELADRGELVATSHHHNNYLSSSTPSAVTPYFGGAFAPSHCSVCSSPVALQLLTIWIRLFQSDPANVLVTQETIELMLEENIHLSKSLLDLKRFVVREIAVKAPPETSRLVLNELSKRLRQARDVTSAEILGKIISSDENGDFPLVQEYVNLALEALKHETIY